MRRARLLSMAALFFVGCGGKVLDEMGEAGAGFGSGAGSASGGGVTGSSSGFGGPLMGSSSGAGTAGGSRRASSSASSSGGFGGSSSSGGSSASGDGGIACMNGSVCAAGLICCGVNLMTTRCQPGPCPNIAMAGFGPVQLCATTAECFVPGDTCGPLAAVPTVPIKVCSAPMSDGGRAGGRLDAGGRD